MMGRPQIRKGTMVRIGKATTKLVRQLDIPGGWEVDPPVQGLRFWTQDEMTRADSHPLRPVENG